MGFVPIRTYPSGTLAQLDKGVLEAEGIVAMVEGEGVYGSDDLLSGAVGGIRLSVPEKDVAAARALLAPPAMVDDVEVEDSMRCPHCRSEMISDYRPYLWMVIFLGPLAIPAWVIKRTLCHQCGHRWKRDPVRVVPVTPKPVGGILPASARHESLAANPYATPHASSAPASAEQGSAPDHGSEPPSGT